MAPDLPFDAERFCRRFLSQGHNGLMGLRYLTSGADWIDLELPVTPALLDHDGHIADGQLVTLVDMAATVAIWLRLGRWIPHATIDLRLDRPGVAGSGGALTGHARCEAIEDGIAFVAGHAAGGSELPLARFAATYKLLG